MGQKPVQVARPKTEHVVDKRVLQTGLSGIYIPTRVHGIPTKLIIDSGSSVTILAQKRYQQISEAQRPPLRTCHEKLSLADGSDLPVLGLAKIVYNFGHGLEIIHDTIVAEINSDGLIGIDFFKAHECKLDYQDNAFVINGTSKHFVEMSESVCYQIVANEEISVEPKGFSQVKGVLAQGPREGIAVVESIGDGRLSQYDVGNTLVDTTSETLPVHVYNASDELLRIRAGDIIAVAKPTTQIRHITSVSELEGINKALESAFSWDQNTELSRPDLKSVVYGPLPEYLHDLLERSKNRLNEGQVGEVRNFLLQYSTVFSCGSRDIGRCNILPHRIPTGSNPPVKLPPRKVPLHLREEVNKELDKLLAMKVITPANSPWSSCMVVVRKPDGSVRLCLDVRALNARSEHDAYPLPRVDTCLESMRGSKWFSCYDLCQGFHQLVLHPEDAPKTAFSTERGSYMYLTLPYGLKGGPATCQRTVDIATEGVEGTVVYMDDLICTGSTFRQAFNNLVELTFRLMKANLKVKTSKCTLFQNSVSFLGHVISDQGIATSPEKTEKVKNWPTPTNLTEVKSFLGLCSYYGNFIPNFAEIAHPLHQLSKKDVEFQWSDQCENAFVSLKKCLTTSPILSYPNEEDKFVLDVDASNYSIGAVLSQIQNGEERVIAYASRSLKSQELNYCTTRKELLALVHWIPHFKHFLLAKKFLLRSDHGSLYWLFNWRDPEGQIARWLSILGPYDFDIEHRPGKKHGNADALSRYPCKQCGKGVSENPTTPSDELRAKARDILKQIKLQHVRAVHNDHTYGMPNNDNVTDEISEPDPSDSEPEICSEPWLKGYTSEELANMQASDENIAFVYTAFKEKNRPTWQDIAPQNAAIKSLWADWDRLNMIENVLYRQFHVEGHLNPRSQLILPQRLVKMALTALHDGPNSCHVGRDKTLAAVQQRVYFHGYKNAVMNWVRKCEKCNSKKLNPKKKYAPMVKYTLGMPLERVAIDIAGPFPVSEGREGQKFRYILVATDSFTKYRQLGLCRI